MLSITELIKELYETKSTWYLYTWNLMY
jgi:hypothetical protein